MAETSVVPFERIERLIFVLHGQKVILDRDLAVLYGVTTGNLNKAVGRNMERFPADFLIEIAREELRDLKFHFGRSRWGGTRKPPRAFTEQGVAMLSSVLRSPRAVRVNIEIMRAFVRIRRAVTNHRALAAKLAELENKLGTHDKAIRMILDAIDKMMNPPDESRRKIGFRTEG